MYLRYSTETILSLYPFLAASLIHLSKVLMYILIPQDLSAHVASPRFGQLLTVHLLLHSRPSSWSAW